MNEECSLKKWRTTAQFLFLHSSFLILPLLLISCATKTAPPQTFSGAPPLEWSRRLADSELARFHSAPKLDYTVGLFSLSFLKLDAVAPDARYLKFAESAVGSLVLPDGKIQTYNPAEFQLDSINPGKTFLALWQITHEERYKNAATILRRQLDTQPRTFDGGFWHKLRYTNQMWLDGIYMGDVFYAEYAKLFDQTNDFDEIARQFRLIDEHLYDAESGLFYHGWDAAKIQPWANPATGASSNFWGRADGWYAMALVDTLDFIPTNDPARARLLAQLEKFSAGIVKWQDAGSGLWWQVMDQGNRKGNYLEATASAMFVYALAKGVNHGYLPRDYIPAIQKGYRGIIQNLIKDDGGGKWSLTQCCQVAGLGGLSNGKLRDGGFDYYVGEPFVTNDLKGIGPFILAGIELQELLKPQ
jgi:unsaturated rhamnogalacturonyl hydrolase